MSLKSRFTKMKENNELSTLPLKMILKSKVLWGVPFHIWELAIAVGASIGALLAQANGFRAICVIIAGYCYWGAWVDYHAYNKFWKKEKEVKKVK